ncbi:MAG: hypothetical protein II826_07840 [Prevotella sp.]|nr:hypothetical protein [Prevotella sp.]
MSSIKNLEMAAAVSSYQHIEIKKSLFSTKAIYKPTQSQVKATVLEYTPSEGERLERLLSMPLDKMVADIAQKGKPTAGANGNFRLEVCLSDDRQFVALQLFRFIDFSYRPLFETRFYEGKEVEYITELI